MDTKEFDPIAAFRVGLAEMARASQSVLVSTWRQHAKACANLGEPAWPLSETNIEFSVRLWIASGASVTTLKLRRWAFKRWLELAGLPCDIHALSLEAWTRFGWGVAHRDRPPQASQITMHETALLIDAMQRLPDSDWLRTLVMLTNQTGVPLRMWLQLRQRDVQGEILTIHNGTRQFAVPLDGDDRVALQPLLKLPSGDSYVFSSDGGVKPLSPDVVNRHLRMTSRSVLGHAVTMRMVQAAALRFLLQLGISPISLSESTGLSRGTVIRLSGLPVGARDYSLATCYGIPLTWQTPSFAEFYRFACAAREPYTGARDRAILSLLFFDFATPDAVSAMDRDDVYHDSYSLPREDGLYVTLAEDHVVNALAEWTSVRGSQPGPLFINRSSSNRMQRMSARQIEIMVRERTKEARPPFNATSLRWAGVLRAAQAGLPLAQLADMANLNYVALADGLGLYQRAETVAQVTRQIEALRAARLSPAVYEDLCRGQLRRCYIHAGTP